MPMMLKGSCHCATVRFTVESHTPVPYQLCYCSICRKQQGGGGYAINLAADARTLKVTGEKHLGLYRAEFQDDKQPGISQPAKGGSAANAQPRYGFTIRPGLT